MSESYGPLVRLWGIQSDHLPAPTATGHELTPFLTSVLMEALPFIADVPSADQSPFTSKWQTKGSRNFPHSTSPVYLYERTVPADALRAIAKAHHLSGGLQDAKLPSETWFLRRSVHKDAAEQGTASWDEWVRNFKWQHALSEKEFTPTVIDTREEREWDCREVEVEYEGETWSDWTLKLEESVHKMPVPLLKNRIFPVLQATASVKGQKKFLVVQMAAGDVIGEGEAKLGDNVKGKYSSIERFRDTGNGIEWVMGTTSDAKGSMPLWLQKPAMPGAVAKDVDMFLEWIPTQRSGKSNGATVSNGSH